MGNKNYTTKQKEMKLGDTNIKSISQGDRNNSRLQEINNLLSHVDSTIKTLELEREDLLQEKSILMLRVSSK